MTFRKILFLCGAAGCAALAAPRAADATADPFIGEIAWVGELFCPRNWAEANGQLLEIATHTALFSLYGTAYGGDGRTTFGLPDLRGRVMISVGQGPGLSNYVLGQKAGAATATMSQATMPAHTHGATLNATSSGARTSAPADASLSTADANIYTTRGNFDVALEPGSAQAAPTGGMVPFQLMQPYQVLRACVALQGVYPSRP